MAHTQVLGKDIDFIKLYSKFEYKWIEKYDISQYNSVGTENFILEICNKIKNEQSCPFYELWQIFKYFLIHRDYKQIGQWQMPFYFHDDLCICGNGRLILSKYYGLNVIHNVIATGQCRHSGEKIRSLSELNLLMFPNNPDTEYTIHVVEGKIHSIELGHWGFQQRIDNIFTDSLFADLKAELKKYEPIKLSNFFTIVDHFSNDIRLTKI